MRPGSWPGSAAGPGRHAEDAVPQAGQPDLRLLARVGVVDPTSLDDFARTADTAPSRALALGPERVIKEVTRFGLVGRGGAAFPTGRKWEAVAARRPTPITGLQRRRVGARNLQGPGADGGRPVRSRRSDGDRGFRHRGGQGYIYIRGEYPLAKRGSQRRSRPATRAGPARRARIGLRRGAGAYICGEETALFESIEGKRGEPRNKPPYPVQAGLFGKPTVVNNVETMVNVLLIVVEDGGRPAFKAVGTPGSAGTKLFCVSGSRASRGYTRCRSASRCAS